MRVRRTAAVELSPIKSVELAAARRPDVVSLAQGIPSFDTPDVIKAYVRERLVTGDCGRYSLCPGSIELRELIADTLRAEGMRYDPDGEILITAGAIEAISASLLALIEPGAEVILPSPCYASYQQVIRMAGCTPRFVPLDEERNFDLDVAAIARLVTPRTAALFYCNPNNPTGTIYSREQSLQMLELAEQHDLYVITDEVYKDFRFTDEPYFTPAQQEDFRHRVVRIFSFSKAYAMTGWRVGYLHTAREVADRILRVHDALVTCAPVISQHAAAAALLHGNATISEFKRAYRRRRDIALRHLDELSHIFDYQKPSGAYFVFPRLKDTVPLAADSRALAADLLERAGVALVPGIAFGPTGEGHLRLSFSRDEAAIDEAFARMRAYFSRSTGTARPARAAAGRSAQTKALAALGATPVRSLARHTATAYLQSLARHYLRRRRPQVVAIAGFRGKTVFKRVLGGLLRRTAVTRFNPRSYNTEIGLPLAVLGVEINPKRLGAVGRTMAAATARSLFDRQPLELLVLELGARQRGDMAALLRTVQPDWAIITSIAEQALEQSGALGVVQAEIGDLLAAVPQERLLVCADDELLAELLARRGICCERLLKQRLQATGGRYRFTSTQRVYEIGGEIVGDSAAYAVQAAILLGEQLAVPADEIVAFLVEETGAGAILAPVS